MLDYRDFNKIRKQISELNYVTNQCDYQWWNEKTQMLTPCGRCINCKKSEQNRIAGKLIMQDMSSISCAFLTLTYADEHLPNGEYKLSKEHTQRFIRDVRQFLKREIYKHPIHGEYYRKTQKKYPFKYFLCGEYGEKYGRPHYHVLIFNLHHEVWPKIARLWKYGRVDVQKASGNGVHSYVSKYVTKVYTTKPSEMPSLEELAKKPFRSLSKNLGLDHFMKIKEQVKSNGGLVYSPGKYCFMAQDSWKKLIYTEQEWEDQKEKRRAEQREHIDVILNDIEERTGKEPTQTIEAVRRMLEERKIYQHERDKRKETH